MSAMKRALLFASLVAGTPGLRRDIDLALARRDALPCPVATVTATVTGPAGVPGAAVTVTSTVATVTTVVPGPAGAAISCFNAPTIVPAAYAAPAVAPAADPAAVRLFRRGGQQYAVYQYIQYIECECQNSTTVTTAYSTSLLPGPSTSAVASVTPVASTSAASVTPAPSVTPAASCTLTQTSTITATVPAAIVPGVTTTISVTATVTNTAPGVATLAANPQGLNYYYYNNIPYEYGPDTDFVNAGFVTAPKRVGQVMNNPNFAHSGTISNPNALKITPKSSNYYDDWQRLEMPDGYISDYDRQFNIIFQGYIYAAAGAGTYIISTPAAAIDDVNFAWTGEKALGNNWNADNKDYMAQFGKPEDGTVSLTLAAGQAVPITLFFADLVRQGHTAFYVTTPDGVVHQDPTGFFVGGCGNAGFMP